jgi:phosphopantothenoylcysteine decarboxylase/phosphopantothenate--cysteine ligase
VLSRSALEFVGAVTFDALTGRPAYTALVEAGHALDHIKLARAAEVIVVAPATADFLSRAASGRADDLLAACLLATTAPVLLVPAMNDRMWAHGQTVQNVAHLRKLGYTVIDPDVGDLAAGEGAGPGRMPEPETILAHIGRRLERPSDLSGKRIVVSAGPTRESIDPVRFITNKSSGKMGVAIAAAAWRRGAEVTLITGPTLVAPPPGACVTRVETTKEMRDAIAAEIPTADALIMAAAPADFAPAEVATSKIKKESARLELSLGAAPDILVETIRYRRQGMVVVGFALETDDGVANAAKKLDEKDLDLIVLNDAREEGAGFEVDTNRVTILKRGGDQEELPLLPKADVADAILDRVVEVSRGR